MRALACDARESLRQSPGRLDASRRRPTFLRKRLCCLGTFFQRQGSCLMTPEMHGLGCDTQEPSGDGRMSRLADACGRAFLDKLLVDACLAPTSARHVVRVVRPTDPTDELGQSRSGGEEVRHLRDGADVDKACTAQIAGALPQGLIERNQGLRRTSYRCNMTQAASHDAVQYGPRKEIAIGRVVLFAGGCGCVADSSTASLGRLIKPEFDDELTGKFDPISPLVAQVIGSSAALSGSFF